MPFLLDTSIAIAMRDGEIETVDRLTSLPARPSISVLTRVELEGGVYVQPQFRARRRSGLIDLLNVLPVIDFTSEMAERYGRIVAELGFNRRKIIDRMIAATALERDLKLITTNAADFAEIDGLALEIWNA